MNLTLENNALLLGRSCHILIPKLYKGHLGKVSHVSVYGLTTGRQRRGTFPFLLSLEEGFS